jgi:hypothetical protein
MKFILCIHTIGVPKGLTLLEFKGAHQEEEQEQPEEPEVPASEESAVEELPECLDHRPSSFSKSQVPVHTKPTFVYLSLSTFTYLLH